MSGASVSTQPEPLTSRRRRWLRWLIAVVALWTLAAAALVGLGALDAVRGRDVLLQVRDAATAEDLRDGRLDGDIARGGRLLDRAHGRLANPLVTPFRLLPIAGRQLTSARDIVGTGANVAGTAVTALEEGRRVIDADGAGPSTGDRAVLLADAARIAGSAEQRLSTTDLGPRRGLIGPLADARDELSTQVARLRTGLRRTSAGAAGLARLLDDNSRYLVVAANNGEMRSGSGLFLSAGLLTAEGDELDLGPMTTVGEIIPPAGSVEWPNDLRERWGPLSRPVDLRALMLSPRFDVAAPLAARIWEADGRPTVDGVIVLDPVLLEEVLRATGSVRIGSRMVSGDNVVTELLLNQYRNMVGDPDDQAERRSELADVADAAVERIGGADWQPVALGRALGRAVEGRHLLVWSKDPALNVQWQRAGVSGELSAEDLALGLVNLGGNKVDQFMDVDATVTASPAPDLDRTEVAVAVTVANRAPAEGPGYVLGPFPGSGFERGQYHAMVTLHVPDGARDLRISRTSCTSAEGTGALRAEDTRALRPEDDVPLGVLGADGPTEVIGTRVDVRRGETSTLNVCFSVDRRVTSMEVQPSARVPATTWAYRGMTWTDDRPQRLALPRL